MFQFSGLSVFIWMVKSCTAGLQANTPEALQHLAEMIRSAGLRFAPVKITDGPWKFNLTPTPNGGWVDDILPGLFDTFRSDNLPCIGWSYIYGQNPINEAEAIASRVYQLNLDAVILDPEKEYKKAGAQAATIFMNRLKKLIPDKPLALCSYRFPTLHRELPWSAFLAALEMDHNDVHMPQVYWLGNNQINGPALELDRSIKELTALKPLPVYPVGCAYGQRLGLRYWQPSTDQMTNFDRAAEYYACPGLAWWNWDKLAQKDSPIPLGTGKLGWWKSILSNSSQWQIEPKLPDQTPTVEDRLNDLTTRIEILESAIQEV